jgi:hypothetical protein
VGPYHRVETPKQTMQHAKLQVESGLMCGKIPFGGAVPCVQAYVGVLPDGERGIEFTTEIPPLAGTVPHVAYWRQGSPGVHDAPGDMVCIPVFITKNTQV